MPTNGLYLPDTYPANKVPDNFYIAGGSGKGSSYYFNLSGTSMATPGVSGSVALLLQQTPSLTPDQVKARLMESADRNFPVYGTAIDPATGLTYTTQYDIFTIGAGSLDIVAALNNTDTLPPGITALSPTASYSSLTRTVTIAAGWEGGLGLATLFGTHTLLANTVVWGDCMVWGDPTAAGFSALWGNSVVWGGTTSPGETSAITISGEE
jgi:serine protease AprX